MKQLHVDNETNRVILVAATERRTTLLAPNLVTVINYVGPFIEGLDEVACINLVCEVDVLKYAPVSNTVVEKRLAAWHAAYVDFYHLVGTARKEYPATVTEQQRADLTSTIESIRNTLKTSLGLVTNAN